MRFIATCLPRRFMAKAIAAGFVVALLAILAWRRRRVNA
jgi:heme A synthase